MKLKNTLVSMLILLSATCLAQNEQRIKISTKNLDLIYTVAKDGRLYQSHFGRTINADDLKHLGKGAEAYIAHGMEDYFEPAVGIIHNDGNASSLFRFKSVTTPKSDDGSNHTIIELQDEKYPTTIKLHYVSYPENDVIKTYTEISNNEKRDVSLFRMASSMLHLDAQKYILTEFHGDWASEVHMTDTELEFGKKVLDTKLGSRANMFTPPFFQLSLNDAATENNGEVILGTIGWTGNFRFTFEVDNQQKLRIISGINPYFSTYSLKPGETFTTPDFFFTYSFNGKGEASRNLHRWARTHQVKDGQETRMTLLNNWEATYFDFDETKLIRLMDDAVTLGVDMFLLDDGWFANRYPRSSDRQGLGDWDETKSKLPNGIGALTKAAKEKGIKFGIWIEPEMVNPKSELYEKHNDWVIHLPNREQYYFRNQMVLDLSNPEVQQHVFSVVDNLMTKYPEIAYFKWDCNSPITNVYSPYLKDKQQHLYIEHVKGLYNILEKIKAKYPNLPMMLCSGGGGRSDYQALKYFTEFWPSDNTDPIERLFIQWGYSQIFPAKTLSAHVTEWNRGSSIKFRTDVAMMGKLGFDINLSELSDEQKNFCTAAVANYNRLKPAILEGDLYRLVSPYSGNHTSSMYVSQDKSTAVLFAFDIHPRYSEKTHPVKTDGLNADKRYRVREINLMPGAKSSLSADGKEYSGAYLMNEGIHIFTDKNLSSRVVEITEI